MFEKVWSYDRPTSHRICISLILNRTWYGWGYKENPASSAADDFQSPVSFYATLRKDYRQLVKLRTLFLQFFYIPKKNITNKSKQVKTIIGGE